VPAPRRRRPTALSRTAVVDAAEQLVTTRPFDEVTIRSLAAELGVAPMSLYRHVRDKDDLLGEVVDRMLAAIWEPSASRRDGLEWLAEAADRLRRLLVEQPAALHVYLRQPVLSPAAVRRMDAMVDVLRGAGLGTADAHTAYAALQTYAVGFAALASSRAGWEPSGDEGDLGAEVASFTSPEQFQRGLHYLLRGILPPR
jgi:TetR/AcrR family tetracycline transcriptional repressor